MPSWTTLHDVAFLYLFVAENLDHELAHVERQEIVNRLSRWSEGHSDGDLTQILRDAHDAVNGAMPGKTATNVIESLKYAALSDQQRREIWTDVKRIAAADGKVHENEHAFLHALARVWGMDEAAD